MIPQAHKLQDGLHMAAVCAHPARPKLSLCLQDNRLALMQLDVPAWPVAQCRTSCSLGKCDLRKAPAG